MTAKAFGDMTSDDRLEFNQHLRHDVIVHLTTNEAGARELTCDKDRLMMIQGFLKDSDRTELTKKRLDLDTAVAENDALAASLLETVLSKYTSPRQGIKPDKSSGPHVDASAIPVHKLAEGEMSDVNRETIDIDDIKDIGRAHFKGQATID